MTERREQFIRQIQERNEGFLYKERKRIGHLKTYDELIRKKQKENAECYSEINESLINDWKVQLEQYKHPNSIPSLPHFDESHLDELLHQIEKFGSVGDTTPPIQYTSKVSPIKAIGKKGFVELSKFGPPAMQSISARQNQYLAVVILTTILRFLVPPNSKCLYSI